MSKFLACILFSASLLICFSETAEAQRILGGVSMGVNLTQVDGDDLFGFRKVGINVGPMVEVPFGPKRHWSVSMELLYSQKGSSHRGGSDSLYSYSYKLIQNYAEIPVLVHFSDRRSITGGVGFSYGQLISYKETNSKFYNKYFIYQTGLANYDISVIADLQIRLWSKLWANLRYQYSVKSNRTVYIDKSILYPPQNPETRYQYNNVISVRLTWVFNQAKISKLPKKERDGDIY
jgi:hypothetical protein